MKANKKLPWRYRWPDDVRDDVLARLLALNAERYAEEVAQGLHGPVQESPTQASRGRSRRAESAPAPRSRRLANPDQTDLLGGMAE